MHACKVVQLIEATDSRGEGTADNPHRMVLQYWTFDGRLLFEVDQWAGLGADGADGADLVPGPGWGSAQFGGGESSAEIPVITPATPAATPEIIP